MSTAYKPSTSSFIQRQTINLAAGRTKPLNIVGSTFACTEASGEFEMSFNDGDYFACRKGVRWTLKGDDIFNCLRFKSDVDTEVTFYAGVFEFHENVVVPVFEVAPTKVVPYEATSIAATTNADFVAVPAGFKQRKGIIVTNNDAASDLEIYAQDVDANWHSCAIVFAKMAWQLETSDGLRVRNPTAAPINFRVLETFYLL